MDRRVVDSRLECVRGAILARQHVVLAGAVAPTSGVPPVAQHDL
ncbi:MAG: hypothetical protein J07HX64_02541 [halophilic archaeon J07HX64]|nr:MAG: hypothetical protein J07HX64_02541 [halophilic archaeon J07HX64]